LLIAGQIALTLLLMTAAGAAIEGFLHMMRIPLGYDPHNVMSVGIPVHDNTYKTIAERVLAAVGLYSVVSYSVVQRTNEFGIRMALGARKKDVLWNVAASAGVSVGSGLLAGLALSLGLNRVISRWVENSAQDPWLIVGVSCVLLAVAGLACLLPSWRASSVDPMTALRCE
jgi:hypothetical protein